MPKLYTSRICPFAHRVRLVLREKEIGYETIEIDLKAMPDWYRALSPNQKVPLWQLDDGQLVWESAIINEFLEDAYPTPALLPESPLSRARVRLATEEAGNTLLPAFYGVARNGEPVSRLEQALDALESRDFLGGPWWVGPDLSLADLNIYPWFERLPLTGLGLDPGRWPRLAAWQALLAKRPAVRAEAGSELPRGALCAAVSRPEATAG